MSEKPLRPDLGNHTFLADLEEGCSVAAGGCSNCFIKDREIESLTVQLAEARKQLINDGSTHYEGCSSGGSKHYQCALQEIKKLTEQLAEARWENEILRKRNHSEVVKLMTNGTDALTVREQQAEERGARSAFEMIAEKDAAEYGYGTRGIDQVATDWLAEWRKRNGKGV